ncbi:MAG: type III secretion system export apparatus subunit SctT [Kiritimatiellae bacterium]|nr:type III secretion system export apparatus subunit SctT [Kiritimatiellia bacterium]
MEYSDFHRIILAFVLAAARIGGAMAICPATSSSMITGLARNAATLSFAALAVPCVLRWMPPGEIPAGVFCAVAAKEAAVGFLIGFFASIPFWVAENVGNFIDNQRGATMGEVYSPLSGAQVSTTGIFFTQIVSTIFFVGGAVLLFLAALYKSYDIVPMFGGWPGMRPDAPAFALGTLDGMMRSTFIISAPVIILMFLATIGLGFVNRTAPQLNVFFLSMPVKSALGVAMLVAYLGYIIDMLMYTDDSAILGPLLRIIETP